MDVFSTAIRSLCTLIELLERNPQALSLGREGGKIIRYLVLVLNGSFLLSIFSGCTLRSLPK